MLWPRYTAGGGADGDSGRRKLERELRTEARVRKESQGVGWELLLGHPGHLGFMGFNGLAHEFSFSFFQLLNLKINTICTQI
jgi:hypothetical protein